MKKDNFFIKFLAFLLSVVLWGCIISLTFLGGLKPMATSLVESIIEEELSANNVMNVVANNTEITPEQQQIITDVVADNPEIEQLMDVYLDGVNLTVDSNYLVPSINNGLVVFVGVKENYGNVIIVQSEDGVNVWYGNLNNINVPIYKYVKKGELIGECNQSLYLVFKKDGNVLDYKKYI